MTEYLLEIGCEEIPSRFMNSFLQALKKGFETALADSRITFKHVEVKGTYRRLAVRIIDSAKTQSDLVEEVKGPPAKIALDDTGKLLPPGLGFCKKWTIPEKAIKITQIKGVDYICAKREEKGRAVNALLPELVSRVVSSVNLPIAMRWGSVQETFIRPVHWVVSLLDDKVVPLTLFGIKAGRTSFGHRFLTHNSDPDCGASGKPFEIKHASAYEADLLKHFVIVDAEKRYQLISEFVFFNVDSDAVDKDLLEEVTYLVEYPEMLLGKFNKSYLKIPKEVLIQCMKKHQKYFPIIKNGKLEPGFIATADSVTKSNRSTVISGNESVLVARLEDARFFWEEDHKTPLVMLVPKLKTVLFQKDLGSVYDKMCRVKTLASYLTDGLGFKAHDKEIQRTAELCKADLVSQMVFEFPGLQGIMGRLYAKEQNEDKLVAQGIEEHYQPRFSGDKLPQTPTGITVSLADKIDTVVSCFLNNLIPSGSQDPWGIRRAVFGIIEIVLGKSFQLNLEDCVTKAYGILNKGEANKQKLMDFFQQRVKSVFLEQQIAYDIVDSVMDTVLLNVIQAKSIAKALDSVRAKAGDDFKLLADTGVRVKRLSKKAGKETVQNALFIEKIEHSAWKAFLSSKKHITEYLDKENYTKAVHELIGLSAHVTDYFDQVLVMAENDGLRKNRLAFLRDLNELFNRLADFEKIVV
ncbi:glycine--tRNA ligase subunit beta [Thermoproteota archaeon]